MTGKPMEIDVWKGDWCLPSVDIECLRIMAYLKFCKIEESHKTAVKVNSTNNPFWSPTGCLPVFRHEKNVITSFPEVVKYLASKNFTVDDKLTTLEQADCKAFSELLRDKLLPAIHFTWWLDQTNFTDFTRPWYASALPFPLNFYYPYRYEKQAKAVMEALFPNEEDSEVIRTYLFNEADNCLQAVSVRLGNNNRFMFGNSPTSLDATVYSYIAPLLNAPLPNNVVQFSIKKHSNLVRYVARISQLYFPKVVEEYNEKVQMKEKRGDDPNRHWRQVFAFCFAVTAMAGFAIHNGIFQNARMSRSYLSKLGKTKQKWKKISSEPS